MKDKTTLFEYLYENLKEQIVSGRIKCGESLPSMNSVSEQYNIGIRTVKDVFRALSSEGYIKTEERKAAVVIYSDNKDSQKYREFDVGNGIIAYREQKRNNL